MLFLNSSFYYCVWCEKRLHHFKGLEIHLQVFWSREGLQECESTFPFYTIIFKRTNSYLLVRQTSEPTHYTASRHLRIYRIGPTILTTSIIPEPLMVAKLNSKARVKKIPFCESFRPRLTSKWAKKPFIKKIQLGYQKNKTFDAEFGSPWISWR